MRKLKGVINYLEEKNAELPIYGSSIKKTKAVYKKHLAKYRMAA